MRINRNYIKEKILKTSNEIKIIDATKKIQKMYGIPWYVLYNFSRQSIPNEETLLKIIEKLELDTNRLFTVD